MPSKICCCKTQLHTQQIKDSKIKVLQPSLIPLSIHSNPLYNILSIINLIYPNTIIGKKQRIRTFLQNILNFLQDADFEIPFEFRIIF